MNDLQPDLVASRRSDSCEAHLMELARSLERVAAAYGKAVDLLYKTETHTPGGPWLEKMHARARQLLAECRTRATLLIDTPSRTLTGSAVKSQALLRYWEADIECDPRGYHVMTSICSDIQRLAAGGDSLLTVPVALPSENGPAPLVGSSRRHAEGLRIGAATPQP